MENQKNDFLVLVGIIILIWGFYFKNKKNYRYLIENGALIYATITSFSKSRQYGTRRTPAYIYARYVDPYTGIEHIFQSQGLYNISDAIASRFAPGNSIGIYVEPGNFKNYCFNLGSA